MVERTTKSAHRVNNRNNDDAFSAMTRHVLTRVCSNVSTSWLILVTRCFQAGNVKIILKKTVSKVQNYMLFISFGQLKSKQTKSIN